MKQTDIMAMNDDELKAFAIEQQRKIERLYKAQVKLKRNVEAKQAVIEFMSNDLAKKIKQSQTIHGS